MSVKCKKKDYTKALKGAMILCVLIEIWRKTHETFWRK